MTKAEHKKAYIAARSKTARQVIEGKRKIRREYVRIITKVAKVVRANSFKPFLEEQIRAAFPRKDLYNWLKTLILNGRANTARLVADVEKRYIFEALDKVPGHGLGKDKIAAMFEKKIARTKIANSKPYLDVVKNAKEKYTGTGFAYKPEGKWEDVRFEYTFRQSYSLSKSVWDTVNHTENDILDVVRGGISQGRDVRTVAADLMAYVKDGPQVIPGRWGKLEPGTREYVKRFGTKGVDYRAIRLYRSEKYRNLQEAAVEDGESNPACTGEYDWILMPGRGTWNCDCPDIAAAGPYRADNIPPYRHPSCDCMIEPRMKDHDKFIQQLRDYVNEEDTPGAREIEEWALGNDLGEEGIRFIDKSEVLKQDELIPLEKGEIRELITLDLRCLTETLEMDDAVEKAKLLLKRLEITEGIDKRDSEDIAYYLENVIKTAEYKKELFEKGYIVSKKGNIFIEEYSLDELKERLENIKPKEGISWGSVSRHNKTTKAFAYVNSDAYHPLADTDGLELSYGSLVNGYDVAEAISNRIYAQERYKNIVSVEEMPYLLRAEGLSKNTFDRMINTGFHDLPGITALTASEKHNLVFLNRVHTNQSPEVLVRFHYLRDDVLQQKVGMMQTKNMSEGTEKNPGEIDVGGIRAKVERYEKAHIEEGDNNVALDIFDVFVRIIE